MAQGTAGRPQGRAELGRALPTGQGAQKGDLRPQHQEQRTKAQRCERWDLSPGMKRRREGTRSPLSVAR